MLLSLFSGCGGLDLGFENVGFHVGLAYDIRPSSIESWNLNRQENKGGHVRDITALTLPDMDKDFGASFYPSAVVGGPPCQSFTRANSSRSDDDPRRLLVHSFFSTALTLHRERRRLDFILMENVTELRSADNGRLLNDEVGRLQRNGFHVEVFELQAAAFGVPQNRNRLFVLALPEEVFSACGWIAPDGDDKRVTVRTALSGLPEPVQFDRTLTPKDIPHHPNHWCMKPKSRRFFDGSLEAGYCTGRSFKTLAWDAPSITVSYGHREVHVHPNGKRRLSVFEGLLLQGFPEQYKLAGTLSSQIDQVSEAVPPPLALAVASAIKATFQSLETLPNWVPTTYNQTDSNATSA